MNYSQVENFLFSRVAFFSRKNQNYEFHLEIMRRWLELLGNPHLKIKAIHIGGTNGKGSVCLMLSEILIAQGYKVGRYISPHLYDMRERISFNGTFIEQDFVTNFINSQMNFINQYRPSFFEIMTVMAWGYFQFKEVDLACVEVGLGGRLDATNLIAPVLSIITNVSLDHVQYLGTTVENIAQEKLGIVKKAIPLLIGRKDPCWEKQARIQAQRHQTKCYFASDYYQQVKIERMQDRQIIWVQNLNNSAINSYSLKLMGNYQQENLLTVLQAIDILGHNFPVSDKALRQGLDRAFLPGRWQTWNINPRIITDVAHNQNAMQWLGRQLQEQNIRPDSLHILLALTKEKNAPDILKYLPKEAQYYTTNMSIPRSMDAEFLATALRGMGRKAMAIENPQLAFNLIYPQLQTEDTLLITGSFFLIADLDLSN